MINYTTGNKAVVDTIDSSACSTFIDPTLEETMKATISMVYNPPEDEEEEEEEYKPDDDDDLWDYG